MRSASLEADETRQKPPRDVSWLVMDPHPHSHHHSSLEDRHARCNTCPHRQPEHEARAHSPPAQPPCLTKRHPHLSPRGEWRRRRDRMEGERWGGGRRAVRESAEIAAAWVAARDTRDMY